MDVDLVTTSTSYHYYGYIQLFKFLCITCDVENDITEAPAIVNGIRASQSIGHVINNLLGVLHKVIESLSIGQVKGTVPVKTLPLTQACKTYSL